MHIARAAKARYHLVFIRRLSLVSAPLDVVVQSASELLSTSAPTWLSNGWLSSFLRALGLGQDHEVPRANAKPSAGWTAMIDHVLAVLRGEAESQITPTSTLDALDPTLDIDQKVNSTR